MSHAPLTRLACWLLALGLADGLWAAAPGEDVAAVDFVMREWHAADGLPSDLIWGLAQDEAGFLWVTTNSGAARFAGGHFRPYRVIGDGASRPRGLIAGARLGVVTALAKGGLARLKQEEFVPWNLAAVGERRVVAALAEPGGAVWLGCEDGRVIREDGADARVFSREQGVPGPRNRAFARDATGAIWISGDNAVVKVGEGGRLVPQEFDFGVSKVRVVSSATGGVWVITQDRVGRLADGQWHEVAVLPPRLGAHYVQAALEDKAGRLWIGTRSQGVHVFADGRRWRVPTSHEDIHALTEDREGNIWVGTYGGGLDRIRPRLCRVFDKTEGLLDNYSYSVCTDRDGDVWFGNRDGGLARWRRGRTEHFNGRPGWPAISAVSVFPLADGGVGVTTGIGVFLVSGGDAPTIRKVSAVPPPADSPVRVSCVARNGDVWFSFDGGRLGRLRGERFEFLGREHGVVANEVRAIAEGVDGRIWVGTDDGSLFRGQGDRFERVALPGVEVGAIRTIRIEADGAVWLGTYTAGLVVLAEGKIATCSTRHGLPEDDITQILPDGRGFVWFAGSRSLFRVARQEIVDVLEGRSARVSPRNVGRDDGINDIVCSGLYQPGACQSADGTLWFATRRGVVAIDPNRQFTEPLAPRIVIDELACDERPISLALPLRVDGQVRKIEFRFDVLCLSHPEEVVAEYRLDGFDSDWVGAPASRRAIYPRLPPGRYRLDVRASVGGGAAPATIESLAMIVVPRWWQTRWFLAAALLAGTGGVYFIARFWSHRRLRQKVEKLEREMAIRTRIAQNLHDDLGANLTHVSLLTQTAARKPGGDVASFAEIHSAVSEIVRSMDEIVWAVNPKFDDAESFVGYLGDFAKKFLAAGGIRCRLELPDEPLAQSLPSETRHHLFLCAKEALNNIVKHSGATEVLITVALQKGRMEITIEDNGRGPTGPRAEGTAPGAADRIATGNGTENMRLRMAEVGGSVSVRWREGGGTTVLFQLNVGRRIAD